ncbi:hypothetical protein [Nonomuraea sp. NPDC050783]|uniref:hypothetical protein n=1 Tax=Nonomuraea sp. NPDC050783 TaxID=3154634 RepID=UPI003466564F
MALFALGRRYQNMLTMRQVWKQSAKQVTARKVTAHQAARAMIGITVLAAFVIWLVFNLNRVM